MKDTYAYLFEAKFIQQYILAGGKLKDIIGASELVESLCPEQVEVVLDTLEPQQRDSIVFSRNAGGAFYAFSEDKAALQCFRDMWTLTVMHSAPGLSFIQALGQGETQFDAFADAREALRRAGRRPSHDPLRGNPFVLRNPRTGVGASTMDGGEALEVALVQKRKARDRHGVLTRFSPKLSVRDWPFDLDPSEEAQEKRFPFLKQQTHIAIIHADGNGLGNLLRQLTVQVREEPDRFLAIFKGFSELVKNATEGAVQDAVAKVLVPEKPERGRMPARPVLIGGDDLTLIVRADLAVSFTTEFLKAFEKRSKEQLTQFCKDHAMKGLPERLTACAGIAFARYSQPFGMVYTLAESLCNAVKRDLNAGHAGADGVVPSALAFHRLTGSSQHTLEQVLVQEKMSRHGETTYCHGLALYTLDEIDRLPWLGDLLSLYSTIKDIPGTHSSLRQYLGTLYVDPRRAARLYERWRRQSAHENKAFLDGFDAGLATLLGDTLNDNHPYAPVAGEKDQLRSPIADLLTLASMQQDANNKETD